MKDVLSDEFHLCGRASPADDDRNFSTLQLILGGRCVRRSNAVPGDDRTSLRVDFTKRLADGEMVVPSVACYADIPFPSLAFHAAKYGRFGLSFHRDLLIRRGARPVMYVPMRSDDRMSTHGATLLNDIQAIYRGFDAQFVEKNLRGNRKGRRTLGKEPDTAEGVIEGLQTVLAFHLLAFLKVYDSELPIDHVDYYYSEREWRSTTNLNFVDTDVARVVVERGYAMRLAAVFPQFSGKVSEI